MRPTLPQGRGAVKPPGRRRRRAHLGRLAVLHLPGPDGGPADGLAVDATLDVAHDHDRAGDRAEVLGEQHEVIPGALHVGVVLAHALVPAVGLGAADQRRGAAQVQLAVVGEQPDRALQVARREGGVDRLHDVDVAGDAGGVAVVVRAGHAARGLHTGTTCRGAVSRACRPWSAWRPTCRPGPRRRRATSRPTRARRRRLAECLASSTFALARLLCAEAAAFVPRFEDSARVRLRSRVAAPFLAAACRSALVCGAMSVPLSGVVSLSCPDLQGCNHVARLDRAAGALRDPDGDRVEPGELVKRGAAAPKRPQPECLTPPNGAAGSSWTVDPLTWQMPLSIRAATLSARSVSWPNTAADRPYSVSLAIRTASSTPSAVTTVTTGPNDSSP